MFQYMPENLSDWTVMLGITRSKVHNYFDFLLPFYKMTGLASNM